MVSLSDILSSYHNIVSTCCNDCSEKPGVSKWIFFCRKRATTGSYFDGVEKTILKRGLVTKSVSAAHNTYSLFCFILFIVSSLFFSQDSSAQMLKLKGKVTNSRLEPLSFVTVQIKEQQIGTRTNDKGQFEFELSEGDYDLVFSLIGYEKKVVKCIVEKNMPPLNILLNELDTELGEVKISTFKKDRAEEIVRQVIRHKQQLSEAANTYSANLYIRATMQQDSSDKVKKKSTMSDSLYQAKLRETEQRMSMCEVLMRVDVAFPNKIKETREAVNKRGNTESLFYLTTTDGDFSLYNNLIKVPALTQVPMLSPVSYSGLIAYKYKTLKIIKKENITYYVISFTPGRLGNALIEGEMTIMDSTWAITECQYRFPKFHLVEYDQFSVSISNELVEEKAWMPTRMNLTYQGKNEFGKTIGKTTVVYDQYRIDTTFSKRHFSNELSTTTLEAYEKDSNFWNTIRKEPLSEKELAYIQRNDSIFRATHTKEYLDSVDKVNNKITIGKITLFGYEHYKRSAERTWLFPPAISVYRPFAPGGARVGAYNSYRRIFANKTTLNVATDLSYGIRNENIIGDIRISRKYNPFSQGYVSLNIGRRYDLIFWGDAFINLLRRSNFYQKDNLELEHGLEIMNGLMLRNSIEIAHRSSIAGLRFNESVDSLLNESGFFNRPIEFDPYYALFISIALEYTPMQKYLREPREKIILGSNFPTFYIRWRKGVPSILGSSIDFDFVEYGLRQRLKLGLAGISQYNIHSGAFLNQRDLRYVDYKFISRGNPGLFNNPLISFQNLDTTFPIFNRFYEGHYLHQFNGSILNKIPLIKKLNLLEVAGAGFLISPEQNLRYTEAFVGLEKIIRLWNERFKIGYYFVISAANKYNTPYQFKIGLDQFNKRKNSWN